MHHDLSRNIPEANPRQDQTVETQSSIVTPQAQLEETLFGPVSANVRVDLHHQAAAEGLVAPRGKILGYIA